MLDGPEALIKPAVVLRLLAHKALQYTPGPLRGALAAVLRRGGLAVGADSPGTVKGEGHLSKEAALAELMGWKSA
jgi:hypothetical protein